MYNGGQWPGHGQAESAEIFRELVENTPQIPIDKMVYQAKLMKKRVMKYVSHVMSQRKRSAYSVNDKIKDPILSEPNC